MVSLVRVEFREHGFTIDAYLNKDGNQWCVLIGPDLQEGIAGFGDTPVEAIANFKHNIRNIKCCKQN